MKKNNITNKLLSLEDGLEHAPMNIYRKDAKGAYVWCNKVNAKMLSLNDPIDIIGKTDFDLAWGKEAHTYRKNDLYVIDSRMPGVIEEVAALPSGTIIYLSHKFPLIDKNCKVIGIMGISTDITAKRHLENSVERIVEPTNNILKSLSVHESEVMKLMVSGLKIKDIGTMLNMPYKTVSSHRCRMFRKLNITSDIELMHIVMKYHLKYLINPYLK